jgi:uncharacterized membrane protein (DUF2068 family)
MQRPTGITILAIFYFIGGCFDFVMSCFAMVAGDRLLEDTETSVDVSPAAAPCLPLRGSLVFWIALGGTGVSLFKLCTGAGLWSLQPWGWQLALLRATLKLVGHLAAVIQGAITPSGIVGVLVNGSILLYLSSPPVRQALSGAPVTPR